MSSYGSSTIPHSVSTPDGNPVIMPHVTMIDMVSGPNGILGYSLDLALNFSSSKTY